MRTSDLAEQLTRIPAQPLAARMVLRLIEDENASPAQLARLVEMDPALSARVIRLANSVQNGHRAVTSASRAVVLLGFRTVRGVAAAAASTLLAEDVELGPPDAWAHSIAVAAGAAVSAETLGVPGNEAFSAGLLHDIGGALLHRSNRDAYDGIERDAPGGERLATEAAVFGLDHAEAGATALQQWHFPNSFVQAVRTHHEPVTTVTPLTQTIVLGEALAQRVEPLQLGERLIHPEDVLADLGLAPGLARGLIERTRRAMSEIAAFLGALR